MTRRDAEDAVLSAARTYWYEHEKPLGAREPEMLTLAKLRLYDALRKDAAARKERGVTKPGGAAT